jgi:hypothetical protein
MDQQTIQKNFLLGSVGGLACVDQDPCSDSALTSALTFPIPALTSLILLAQKHQKATKPLGL